MRGAPTPLSCALLSSLETRSAKVSERKRSDLGGSSSVSSSTSSVARGSGMRQRKAQAFARVVIALRHAARERPHAAHIAGALRDRDGAARIEQVERVRALQHHLVGGQHALRVQQPLRFGFEVTEVAKKELGVRQLEVVARLLDFVLVVYIAI